MQMSCHIVNRMKKCHVALCLSPNVSIICSKGTDAWSKQVKTKLVQLTKADGARASAYWLVRDVLFSSDSRLICLNRVKKISFK